MNKLVFLFVMLLLISVVGCSSGDSVTGPDTSDQIQTDNTTQKSPIPDDPPGGGEGDPDTYGDGLGGPPGEGDPGDGLEGP